MPCALRIQRLRALLSKGEDTQMALGSDVLSASYDGYALARCRQRCRPRSPQGSDLGAHPQAQGQAHHAGRLNPTGPQPDRPAR